MSVEENKVLNVCEKETDVCHVTYKYFYEIFHNIKQFFNDLGFMFSYS